ncbi:discoidin domain-containing protein, partial [bacterium]
PSLQIEEGVAAPILDEVFVDRSRLARRDGQQIDLSGLTPTLSIALSGGSAAQVVHLTAPVRTRYVALEVRSEERGGPYASLAELNATGPDGRDLDRKRWRVAYADSEEQDAENGEAANVLDNQPTTYWHTEYGAKTAAMPHLIVIDLGEEVALGSLRLLPRQDGGVNGRIRDLRVYTSPTPFKGQ